MSSVWMKFHVERTCVSVCMCEQNVSNVTKSNALISFMIASVWDCHPLNDNNIFVEYAWTNAKSWVKMNADHSCEWECMCEVRNIRKHATDVNYDYMVKLCCTEHEMNLSHNKNDYFPSRMDIEWVWRAWTELRTHSARILCMTWVRLIISCNKWMWCVI